MLIRDGLTIEPSQTVADLDEIASANGMQRSELVGTVKRILKNTIGKEGGMSRDFRNAIKALCLGRVNPQNISPCDSEIIKQWLRGEKCSLGSLKNLQIYQRIVRHNARHVLRSLAGWLRLTGRSGLVLIVDFNAVLTDRDRDTLNLRYTSSNLLDAFEVLRQFIDDTDQSPYFLLTIVAGPSLLQHPKRSLDRYEALKLRVINEVRPKERDNPLNSMVRLEEAQGGEYHA